MNFFFAVPLFSDLITANGFESTFLPDGRFSLTPAGRAKMSEVLDFMMAFDSNHAPIVGQQITLGPADAATAGARIDLLTARADAGECELVAKRSEGMDSEGYLYTGSGWFAPDRAGAPPIADAALRQLATASGDEITYTCTPLGSGRRVGLDADLDGHLDGDERDAGSNPRDPASSPGS